MTRFERKPPVDSAVRREPDVLNSPSIDDRSFDLGSWWRRSGKSGQWSLQRRVLQICASALLVSLMVGACGMYWASIVEDDRQLDTRLEQLGTMVAELAEEETNEHLLDPSDAVTVAEVLVSKLSNYRYQVWSSRGALLMRSSEAPSDRPMGALGRQGFTEFVDQGMTFRVYSTKTKDESGTIQVAETSGSEWAHPSIAAQYFVISMLLPFAFVAMVTLHLLRLAFRPINAIADQLASRGPSDLGPLVVEHPPQELQPILTAVDALFSRIGHALSVERSFTSMAAHEMRTPLAGIRSQSEAALSATTSDERRTALDALVTGVDRSAHMLDQLLDMARVEAMPRGARVPRERLSFASVYLDVLTDFGPRAAEKQIATRSRFDAEFVSAHPFALYLIMRNLVANAILYTPPGGTLEIWSAQRGQTVVFTVDDSGPGIAQADHARAFERFDRLGRSHDSGVGLGLSIVKAAAQVHDCRIHLLRSPLGGLRVEVVFDPA